MLPPEALKKISEAFRKEANFLEQQARKREQILNANKAVKKHRQKRRSLIHALSALTVDGAAPQAVKAQAMALGLSEDQFFALEGKIYAQVTKVRTAQRNRLICQFAARGYTNAEIGARFGLHEKSISRIVAAALRGPEVGTD